MESYLCTLFSAEIVEGLISNRTFIDIDGQLYFSEASFGFNSMKIKDTSIEKINDKKYIYYVHLIETFPDDTDEGKEIYTVQYPQMHGGYLLIFPLLEISTENNLEGETNYQQNLLTESFLNWN